MSLRAKLIPPGSRRNVIAKRLLRRGPYAYGAKGERKALARAWAHHDAADLDEYLVSGYQDPRINAQSILTRHYLLDKIFGEHEFAELKRAELEFCVESHAILRQRAAELGVTMRAYLDPAKRSPVEQVDSAIEHQKAGIEGAWRSELAARSAEPVSVLELACGSANDYRFFDRYGMAPFLDYTGIDLNETNIDNARTRFPDVSFRVGDVMEVPLGDHSVDYVIAFDIFEHLSLSGMHRTLREATRVARKGMVLSFFNMTDKPKHSERVRNSYHWNELSARKLTEELRADHSRVDAYHVATMLKTQYRADRYYNGKAWTIVAERE